MPGIPGTTHPASKSAGNPAAIDFMFGSPPDLQKRSTSVSACFKIVAMADVTAKPSVSLAFSAGAARKRPTAAGTREFPGTFSVPGPRISE
jgi:hypothetical protein